MSAMRSHLAALDPLSLRSRTTGRDPFVVPFKNRSDQSDPHPFRLMPFQQYIASNLLGRSEVDVDDRTGAGDTPRPAEPTRALLVYHGVGVGKTCTALRAAKAHLRMSKDNKVTVIVPTNAVMGGWMDAMSGACAKARDTIARSDTTDSEGESEGDGDDAVDDLVVASTNNRLDIVTVSHMLKKYKTMADEIDKALDLKTSGRRTKAKKERIRRGLWADRTEDYKNTLFVVDEVHMAGAVSVRTDDTTTTTTKGGRGRKMSTFLEKVGSTRPGSRLLALTATPTFNHVGRAYAIINLLRRFNGWSPLDVKTRGGRTAAVPIELV